MQNNLAVLKRAKKLLLESDDLIAEPSEHVHVLPEAQAQEVARQATRPTVTPKPEAQRNSIGALVLAVLTEAGAPVPLKIILENVRVKGRSEVTLKTLGGVVSQYLSKGVIQRTERATYALPSANGNGAVMHDN